MMMPWLFIILGTVFLLENLNLIPMLNWSIIWPIILILAGLCMLRKRGGDACCGFNWPGKKDEEKK
jgi:hypothetical protein